MAVEFRCEHCGALLSADADAGAEVQCPHCDNVSIVPAGLASLPHPQMPGEEADASGADAAYEEDMAEGDVEPPEAPSDEDGDPSDEDYDEDEEEEEEDDLFGEPSAAAQAMIKATPWIIAVFANAAVMLILVFITILVSGAMTGTDIIVPDARLSDNPGGAVNPTQQQNQQRTRSVRPTPTRKFSKKESVAVDSGRTSDSSELIGMAAGGASGGSPFGTTAGGGGGPASSFYGTGGNAHHIVYAIDRSGSMGQGGKMTLLRQQLMLSIAGLKPVQDFHVIMFSSVRGEAPKEKSPKYLTAATDEFRLQVAKFLDDIGEAEGDTVAAPAIKRAMLVLADADPKKPGKMIYLLTDGELSDIEEVFKTLGELNKRKDVHINTFLLSENEEKLPAQTLNRIATENGGQYKHVSPDEVY
jgi:hypothetical protein